tara:strand:- start:379 stop:969 length:591 start_codon:yes stop_codon:yes gene_type:complete
MTYRTTYEFTCKEFDTDNDENIEREKMHHNIKVDATDFPLNELLVVMEDFLRTSGYDWIEQGSLNIKGYVGEANPSAMSDDEFENFREFLGKLDVVKKPVEHDPQELAERLMGIDRTAKIVSFPKGSGTITPIEKEELIDASAINIPESNIHIDSDSMEITFNLEYDSDGFPTDFDDEDFSQYQFKFSGQEPDIKD